MLLVLFATIHVKYAVQVDLVIVKNVRVLIIEHYLQENAYVMMDIMMMEIPNVKLVKFNALNVRELEIICVKLVVLHIITQFRLKLAVNLVEIILGLILLIWNANHAHPIAKYARILHFVLNAIILTFSLLPAQQLKLVVNLVLLINMVIVLI